MIFWVFHGFFYSFFFTNENGGWLQNSVQNSWKITLNIDSEHSIPDLAALPTFFVWNWIHFTDVWCNLGFCGWCGGASARVVQKLSRDPFPTYKKEFLRSTNRSFYNPWSSRTLYLNKKMAERLQPLLPMMNCFMTQTTSFSKHPSKNSFGKYKCQMVRRNL